MMLLTSVSAEIDTSVLCESPKVATSAGAWGTTFGVQLAAVFQSPEIGSRSHWALIAYATVGTSNITEQRIAARISVFIVISRFGADARDYCRSKAYHWANPSSPQTSMSNSLVVR